MYIGANSIVNLLMFLRGYSYAMEISGLCEDDTFLLDFQDAVQTHYGVTLSKNWAEIIHFYSADDNEAVAIFWRLFDVFCDDRGVKRE